MTTPIDDDLIGPICEIADMEMTDDYHLNQLILAARTIRDREGFLVVDDDDLPSAADVRGILGNQ
jgi:hypothetical protein